MEVSYISFMFDCFMNMFLFFVSFFFYQNRTSIYKSKILTNKTFQVTYMSLPHNQCKHFSICNIPFASNLRKLTKSGASSHRDTELRKGFKNYHESCNPASEQFGSCFKFPCRCNQQISEQYQKLSVFKICINTLCLRSNMMNSIYCCQ